MKVIQINIHPLQNDGQISQLVLRKGEERWTQTDWIFERIRTETFEKWTTLFHVFHKSLSYQGFAEVF